MGRSRSSIASRRACAGGYAGWSSPAATARTSRPPSRCWPPSRASPRACPDHDGLRVRVVVERLGAVLLAVAAALQPAERQLVVDLGARVDPRVAAVELGGGALRALEVARPDRGAETE